MKGRGEEDNKFPVKNRRKQSEWRSLEQCG